jgi:hypothetical protein
VLEWVRQLYDIEDRAHDFTPAERQALRQREAVPILDRIEAYVDELAPRALPKSALGKSLTYARNQRAALRRYVEDGRLTIDNVSEQTVRPQAIGRNYAQFPIMQSPTQPPAALCCLAAVPVRIIHRARHEDRTHHVAGRSARVGAIPLSTLEIDRVVRSSRCQPQTVSARTLETHIAQCEPDYPDRFAHHHRPNRCDFRVLACPVAMTPHNRELGIRQRIVSEVPAARPRAQEGPCRHFGYNALN